MTAQLAIPAIDLKGGRCVRLYQGDPDRETVYGDDPVAMARHWERLGARWLHLVDLDGAFTGNSANRNVIAAIGRAVTIPFQVGGGIRSREDLERMLEAGASRVILGTVMVKQPQLAEKLAVEFGDKLIAGIDAREGLVTVQGWTEQGRSGQSSWPAASNSGGLARSSIPILKKTAPLAGLITKGWSKFLRLAR